MSEEARQRALKILERRDVSRKMLVDKLKEKGVSEQDAAEAADWLCSIGVIDDGRYAALLVRHYAGKGYGERRIREELYSHGIDRALWDGALSEMPESGETVYRLLSSRLRSTACEAGDVQRAQNYLLRRGYSWEEIRAAVEKYLAEAGEQA